MQRPREAAGDLVLRFRKVGAVGVEPVCPEMGAVFRVDQLRVDPHAPLITLHNRCIAVCIRM